MKMKKFGKKEKTTTVVSSSSLRQKDLEIDRLNMKLQNSQEQNEFLKSRV